ncbi:hypothetical protein [Methylobacterium sp. J-076]|uniref:hypothetical protein n=1 Tax=Methylobacterium sp. J-076 TaxID=2836655 RepID=UPI001FBA7ACF|nr:hypothetical protein [Methylobacterium sp. J-076]MCJ2014537.1 hypothetical protein [Methylobacterium sp. J-076]
MRPDLRLRLREIAKSISTAEKRVTCVTRVTGADGHALSHVGVTHSASQKAEQNQSVTHVTRVTPAKMEVGVSCHASSRVTEVVTARVMTCDAEFADWIAHFEERAAIREFEGGFDRAEAERLALSETISALGPQPGTIH